MNRSILIVICDFLVLAALSLSSGSSESSAHFRGHSKNGMAQRDIYVQRLQDRIEEIQKTNQELTENLDLSQKDREELLKALDEKLRALEAAERRLQDTSTSLSDEKDKNSRQSQELASVRDSLKKTQGELDSTRNVLVQTGKSLQTAASLADESVKSLAASKKEVEEMKSELERQKKVADEKAQRLQERDIELAKQQTLQQEREKQLKDLQQKKDLDAIELKRLQEKLKQTEQNLSVTQAKLGAQEELREKTQMRLTMREHELVTAKGELATVSSQLLQTKETLSDTKNSLAQSQNNLQRSRTDLAQTKQNLAQTVSKANQLSENLQELEERLRSNALSHYLGAIQKICVRMQIPRFTSSIEKKYELFAPRVRFGDSSYLVSDLSAFVGENIRESTYSKVKQLSVDLSGTEKDAPTTKLTNSVLVFPEELNAVLIPTGDVRKTDLNALSFENLKKRGTDNLTLFKCSVYGNEYCNLEGRCSLYLSGKNIGYLSIRNSVRNSTELKAEPGDFVISKEGEFVGVVIGLRSVERGQIQEALCFVLPKPGSPSELLPVRITKEAGEEYFSDFSKDLESIHKKINAEKADK